MAVSPYAYGAFLVWRRTARALAENHRAFVLRRAEPVVLAQDFGGRAAPRAHLPHRARHRRLALVDAFGRLPDRWIGGSAVQPSKWLRAWRTAAAADVASSSS